MKTPQEKEMVSMLTKLMQNAIDDAENDMDKLLTAASSKPGVTPRDHTLAAIRMLFHAQQLLAYAALHEPLVKRTVTSRVAFFELFSQLPFEIYNERTKKALTSLTEREIASGEPTNAA